MTHMITPKVIEEYEVVVQQEDLRRETIDKYLTDVWKLMEYLEGEELTQEKLDVFPKWLIEQKKYKKRTVNVMITSTRKFIRTMGWSDFVIRGYSVDMQERKSPARFITRRDYQCLVTEAMSRGKYMLSMLIQTLCHMDIRYVELPAMTVEAVREGKAVVTRNRKELTLIIPDELAKQLLDYAEREGITSGMLFCTSSGKFLDRSYAWREIKELCSEAGLDTEGLTMQKLKMPSVADYYPYYPLAKY